MRLSSRGGDVFEGLPPAKLSGRLWTFVIERFCVIKSSGVGALVSVS